jgi:hypothetical protein
MAMQADVVVKLSLAAAVLLAGAGVGYYFGIFLPAQAIHETLDKGASRETQASDRSADLERARLADEQKRAAAQQRYEGCVASANLAYQDRWSQGCRAQNQRQQAAYDDCADDLFSTREGCARKYPVEPERGCALPVQISSRLVADRDAARAQCLGELQGGYAPPPVTADATGMPGQIAPS